MCRVQVRGMPASETGFRNAQGGRTTVSSAGQRRGVRADSVAAAKRERESVCVSE